MLNWDQKSNFLWPLIGGDLRTKLPSSRATIFSRVAPFDVFWATLSPIVAFPIRDGTFARLDGMVLYSCIAIVVSLIVFQWFRISSPLSHFFSMRDALAVTGACLTAVAFTTGILFIFTRLDEAPRSIPVIHFLILVFGLVGFRACRRVWARRDAPQDYQYRHSEPEIILVIGATRLAWFFSMLIEELCSVDRRIVAILDEKPRLLNRTLNGYSIVGPPERLTCIIDEYASHGVEINKVVVAQHPKDLTERTLNDVRAACEAKNIPIEWLHQTFSVSDTKTSESSQSQVDDLNAAILVAARPYWKIKRLIDFLVALSMIISLAPLMIAVASLVLVDVGVPIVFWQQRIGYRGRPFRVYKFRTMRSLFDRRGQPIPEAGRLSDLGRLLRRNHLDELPQLFNILLGNMSFIGPRPLLPIDQPRDIRFRHQVRPGLTGLAQINGGTTLSADEKCALDEWYIQRASFFLDIRIIFRTIWVLLRGNSRNHKQISIALAARQVDPNGLFGRGLSG